MNRLREPGTGTVSDTSDSPNRAASITRCVPRLGRSRTSGSSSPAQTPVALITARADTSNSSPVERVAQAHAGAGRVQRLDAGEDGCPVPGRRARHRDDEPGVVDELSVPAVDRAAKVLGAQRGGKPERLGGADPPRRIEHRSRRADESAQAVAHAVPGGDDRAAGPVVGRVQRDHLGERSGSDAERSG